MAFPDSHAHLSYVLERSGDEAIEGIKRAYEASGKASILDAGTEPGDLTGRLEKFGHLSFVRFAAGIWPDEGPLSDPDRALSELETHVRNPACRAVGEGGFDFHWNHGTPEAQDRLFRGQLALAVRHSKPMIVHSRKAHAETLAALRGATGSVPVVLHCFGYGPDEAAEYLGIGCYISFAGNLTYANSDALRAANLAVPDDRLLLETDAPYMSPEPRRGKPCTPLDIARTYGFAARLRGTDAETLASACTRNMTTVFGP